MKLFFTCLFSLMIIFSVEGFYEEIQPHIIPQKHKMKKVLDKIFTEHPDAMSNANTVKSAGFAIFRHQKKSKIVILKHPQLKGYLIKGYLEEDIKPDATTPSWQKLLNRCLGAQNIRKLIKKKKIKYFTVPDKWLFILPYQTERVVLLVNDMQLVPNGASVMAWRNKVTKKILDELYLILGNGYASCWLADNIPYTKNGTFSCIDTEYPKRVLNCASAGRYLSPKMRQYWEELVSKKIEMN